MNTFLILETLISYQDKLIQLANSIESGSKVDSDLVESIAINIKELRGMLK